MGIEKKNAYLCLLSYTYGGEDRLVWRANINDNDN